jgi:hypothetical protein
METSAGIAGHAPQCMQALEHANRVRIARADLKRRVAARELDAAEVVLACPWMVESMPLAELLISQSRWGRTRCRTFLKSVALAESKTLGSLTERQRVTLAAVLSANRSGQPSRSLTTTS